MGSENACNQCQFKCDWTILLGLQTETVVLPVPKSCATTYRFCIHYAESVFRDYPNPNQVYFSPKSIVLEGIDNKF